ncbi:MAG: NDP-sugar synthase [Dehalococcoidia bacterium]
MDAIILVGGQGTRLRPLTETRHKSLVPVCNRPAIEYLFDWLRDSGITRAVLAIGQHNDDLLAAYAEGTCDGLSLVHVIERERLESGGAIRNAVSAAAIEGRFLVVNGDVFVDFDLCEAVRVHEERGAALTLALHAVDDPSQFGVAVLDGDGLVTGFIEKPPPGEVPSSLINAGVWIFEPELVAEIPPGAVRVEETLFPSLVARGRRVLGYEFAGRWADIGTPARYLALCCDLARDEPARAVAATASVDPTAVVTASCVGDETRIAAGANVERSVLWERVSVGRDAGVRDSIIADGATVGPGATVDGAVVARRAVIPAGSVVPRGTSVAPGTTFNEEGP